MPELEAIPRNERLIARQARPTPAEGDAREDRQGGAEGGAAAGTALKRSGRARKPKQRSLKVVIIVTKSL